MEAGNYIEQVMLHNVSLSSSEKTRLCEALVWYCASAYHSFRSVEDNGLISLFQNIRNLGANHGKDVKDILVKRRTVAEDTIQKAEEV